MRIVPEVGTSMKTRLVSSVARASSSSTVSKKRRSTRSASSRSAKSRAGWYTSACTSTRLPGVAWADMVAAMAVRPLPVAMHDSVRHSWAMAVCSSKVVLVP